MGCQCVDRQGRPLVPQSCTATSGPLTSAMLFFRASPRRSFTASRATGGARRIPTSGLWMPANASVYEQARKLLDDSYEGWSRFPRGSRLLERRSDRKRRGAMEPPNPKQRILVT